MSFLLDDLAVLITTDIPAIDLASAGGILFLGGDPGGVLPNRMLILSEYPGPGLVETFGPGLPPMEMPRIQIRAMDTTFPASRQLAWDVWKVLSVVAERVVNGVRYNRIDPQQTPFFIAVDERDRVIHGANFQVFKGPTM